MISLLFFGLLLGLAASALRHSYSMRDIIGFVMLATVGAWEGWILAGFLEQYNSIPPQITTSVAVVIGAVTLVYLKMFFSPKTPSV